MALRLLKEGKRSLRDISQAANVPKSTECTISKFLRENDKIGLEGMLNFSKVKGGALTILSSGEELMIKERVIFARRRVFDVGKSFMSQISSDGRPMWKTGTPSDDASCAFRAIHREITFRKAGNKDKAKFKGESYDNIEVFFKILKERRKR